VVEAPAVEGAGAGVPVPSGEPHSPQNFMPGAFAAPQDAHACASAPPHSPQNLRPGSFGVPQDGQASVSATAQL